MSSGQPCAMRSSSLDTLAFEEPRSLTNSCGEARTLDFVFAYVDEGWWVHHVAFEVVYHLRFLATSSHGIDRKKSGWKN